MADLDPIFEAILTELDEALELAIMPDRDQRLNELARRCEALHHLAQAALTLARQDSAHMPHKPLD